MVLTSGGEPSGSINVRAEADAVVLVSGRPPGSRAPESREVTIPYFARPVHSGKLFKQRRHAMADDGLFEKGLKARTQVLGAEYVENNIAGSDEFMMTFQRVVTELAWGYAWSHPGLDQKTRSILTLGILAGLGRIPRARRLYQRGARQRRVS
jgi:4-carboxymuconolactone decarboxylase